MSDQKREAVLKSVRELNYTPSRLAAGLAGSRTKNIGVIIDDFANLWFTDALVGMREALTESGYTLTVADTALNSHLNQDALEAIRSLRVDGVIIAGESHVETAPPIPAIVLGRRDLKPAGVPIVDCDERRGGVIVAEHLVSLGCKNLVAVSANVASAKDRCDGFAARARQLGARVEVVTAPTSSEADARKYFQEWISRADFTPDGVFAANDPMAVGVLGVLEERGLKVPTDTAVVGYDNTPIADYGYLSLTSVDCGVRAQGKLAAELLVEQIEQSHRSAGVALIEPTLVVRGSTSR